MAELDIGLQYEMFSKLGATRLELSNLLDSDEFIFSDLLVADMFKIHVFRNEKHIGYIDFNCKPIEFHKFKES